MQPPASAGRRPFAFPRRWYSAVAPALAFSATLLLFGCGGGGGDKTPTAPVMVLTTVTVSLSATTLQIGQTATATATGADQNGSVIATGPVTWSSGTAAVASVNASGAITGASAGQTQIVASAGGKTGQATLTVVVVPTQLLIAAGNNQSATAGSTVATLPKVLVKDASNNPVSGVTVTFAVATGGGSITGGTQTTNASGEATVGSWTLGMTPGTNSLTAASNGLTSVTFTATAGVALNVLPVIAAAAPNVTVAFAAQDPAGIAQSVTWRVNGIAGGNTQVGSVSGSGQYRAPATIPTGDSVVVSAVLVADTTRQRSSTVFFVPDLTSHDYFIPIPRVVDATRPQSTRFLLVPPTNATNVSFEPTTGATVPLTAIGNGVFTFVLDAGTATAGYQNGTLHNFLGLLDDLDAGGVSQRKSSLVVNVRDATMADVAITSLAADAQRSSHVLNMRTDAMTAAPSSAIVSRALQLLGGDQFDFVAVIATATTVNNRYYMNLRNDVLGIGLPLSDNSQAWGGAGRLRGVINFPIDSYFDGAEQGMIHETGHAWINFATADPVLASGVTHWPASTMALGAMGVSLAGGEGGGFPYSLTSVGSGLVRVDAATPSDRFTPLDLYVMGLLPPDSVPPMYVLPSTWVPTLPFVSGTFPATTYTIANYVASQGVRVPASGTAPHAFATAVVVLTYGRLMTPSEMAFFDAAAARAETTVSLRSVAGRATVDASGFFLATGGRATLRTRLP